MISHTSCQKMMSDYCYCHSVKCVCVFSVCVCVCTFFFPGCGEIPTFFLIGQEQSTKRANGVCVCVCPGVMKKNSPTGGE